MKDWRLAWRGLWRQKSYTVAAVLALALGIGGVTAVFSVVDGVLLRPLPYDQPDRIFFIRQNMPPLGSGLLFSPSVFRQMEQAGRDAADLALFDRLAFTVIGGEQPERVTGAQVSPGFWSMFKAGLVRGRLPQVVPAQPQPDADAISTEVQTEQDVCVIGYEFWQSRFGGREDVLGTVLTLDVSVPFGPRRPLPGQLQIVGVLGPDFRPPLGGRVDILTPFRAGEGGAARFPYLFTFARLRGEMPVEAAMTRLEAIYAGLSHDDNENIEQRSLNALAVSEMGTRGVRPALMMLWAASALVLLIACANVAHLQLARASVRRAEIALRGALGAGRFRLLGVLLSESLLLALLGGLAGVALAAGALQALRAFGPGSLPRLESVSLDWQVLSFALLVSLLTCLLFGLFPAWKTSRAHPRQLLQEEGRGGSGARTLPLRSLLTGAEMALAFVLLVTACVVLQSLGRLQAVDPGFRSESVLTVQMQLPLGRYAQAQERRAVVDRLLRRYQSLPGVDLAGATFTLPFSNVQNAALFQILGRSEERLRAGHYDISKDYLPALDVPLLRGRRLVDSDYPSGEERPRVVVINQAMADQFWADGDPLGARLLFQGDEDPVEIVGVVGNVRRLGLDREAEPILYRPLLPSANVAFVVRSQMEAEGLAQQLRKATAEVDPSLPLFGVRTLSEIVGDSLSRERFNTLLMGCFATVALLLAVTGIYGVVSYTVTGRRREIAVRMALGARPADVLRLVVLQGGFPLLLGTAAGATGAFLLGGALRSRFLGLGEAEPFLYLLAALILNAAALLAIFLPARRAASINPQSALRR